jgi:hypothetical protein
MKKNIIASICTLILATYCCAASDWVAGEIIVQLKINISSLPEKGPNINIASLDFLGLNLGMLDYEKLIPKESPRLPNISKMTLLKFAETVDVLELCRQYKADPNVVFAVPNYIQENAGIHVQSSLKRQ